MEGIKENWTEIKEIIKREYKLTEISYRTWVEPLQFYKVANSVVSIIIPAELSHMLDYISSKYKNFFQVIISEMFDHVYQVQFILEQDVVPLSEEEKDSEELSEKENLNPKYKFSTFVVGSSNKLAHSASLAVAESPGQTYNPLYLYGGPGLGKTHLMHSIGHFILEQNPDKKVLYVTSEEFTNEVIESIRSGNAASMTKLREKYRTVDVLMVDDVQFIIGKESTQEEFFHTFNVLHSARKQIILSSDKPPKDITTLDERFRSRFEWGLTADIQPPDYETRMAILRKNAESCGRQINEEIIKYIATNIKSNIRELEGAFNKIVAAGRLNQVDLTLALAEEALKDMIYPNKSREITPKLIIDVVAEHFGIKAEDICSKKRNSEFVLPRQIVMYLCRELTATSYVNIGKLLGKKDHTTIMHGVNKITAEIKNNEEINNKIDIIIKKINPS
ncbi:MAG: chromosomal replication initiator protein DnaA [Lachnospiraceae bacterium]|jgi:chromosomal replication initiator protein DnaA|nr:chromosomal replication initiator protein DnaA [Lachnospiraceae bacterium]